MLTKTVLGPAVVNVPGAGQAVWEPVLPSALMIIGKLTAVVSQPGGDFAVEVLQWGDATGPDAPGRFAFESGESPDDVIEPHDSQGQEKGLGLVGMYEDLDADPPTINPVLRVRIRNLDPSARDFTVNAVLLD